MEEEKQTISKNYEVLVKTKYKIWRWRVILIPYRNKKEESKNLKIKCTDSWKEERVLIKDVLLGYPKKLLNSTIMEYTWRKLSMISPQKSDKEKIYDIYL